MQQTSYTASNYRQIVCDLKNNILDEVRVIINNRFEDVIKKTDNDNSAEELNIINTLIRQIPIFKKLEEDYKNLIEENIVLKDKLNYFENNKLKLSIIDINNPKEHDKNNNSNIQSEFKNIKLDNKNNIETDTSSHDSVEEYNGRNGWLNHDKKEEEEE